LAMAYPLRYSLAVAVLVGAQGVWGAARYRTMGPHGVAKVEFSTRIRDDSRMYYPTGDYGPEVGLEDANIDPDDPPRLPEALEALPIIGFVLPTYGDTAAGWTQRNEAMARHIASHGFGVVSSLATGGIQDEGRTRIPGRYPVGVYLDAPVHMLQMLQRLADISTNGTATSRFEPSLGPERDGALRLLKDRVDVDNIAIAGYSVGGAGAMWTLELAETRWPGHVVAAMMLAPAIGREGNQGNGARSLFVRGSSNRPAGLNVTKPLLLITGSEDNMGGVDGSRNLYKSSTKAPRIMLEILGATHCFIPYEVANECAVDSYRQQVAAAEHAVAFFKLYLANDTAALPAVWGKELIEGSSMPLSTVWRSSAGPLPAGWLATLQDKGERRAPDGWARLDAEAQVRARAVDAVTEGILQQGISTPELAASAAEAAARAAERALSGPQADLAAIDEATDELPWWVPLPLRIAQQVGEFVGEQVEDGINAGITAATAPFAVIAG